MKKNLIVAHFSVEELNTFDLLQGGKSLDPKTGLREYSKLEHLALSPRLRADFKRNGELAKKHPEETKKLAKELNLSADVEDRSPPSLQRLAKKGRKTDKELALVPPAFVQLLIEVKGRPSVNPETGLLEFIDPFTAGIVGAGIGTAIGAFFGGGDDSHAEAIAEAARIQAESQERLAAQARADAERLKTDMGYYESMLVDKRPRRAALNPEYDSYTAKLGVPRYLGEEFYDPRSGEAIDSDKSWLVADELRKKSHKGVYDPTYKYEPTGEERKAMAKKLYGRAIEGQKAFDDFAGFGLDAKAGNHYGNFGLSEEELLNKYPYYEDDEGVATVKPQRVVRGIQPSTKQLENAKVSGNKSSGSSRSALSQHTSRIASKPQNGGMHMVKKSMLHNIKDRKRTVLPTIKAYNEGGLVSHKVSCGIRGKGTGQSDDIKVNMPVGAYIIDATTTAHLGDGSSTAGIKALDNMVKTISKSPSRKLIERRIQVKKIPVAVANEEYKIDPVTVSVIGGGNLGKGSKLLERMVKRVRQHKAQGGLNLPPQAMQPLQYLKG